MGSQTVLLYTLLLAANYCVFSSHGVPCNKLKKYPTFNHLKLAIQWLPGACVGNPSCRTYNQQWSIHGLWPQNIGAAAPVQNCCEERFNEATIRPLSVDLNTHWTSPLLQNFQFWTYEWNKHGTCAYGVRQLRGPSSFFSKTLQLFKGIELEKTLRLGNVVPGFGGSGSEYSLDSVREIIGNKIAGKRVQFGCRIVDKVSSTPLLHEVYVCYDKGFNVIDCPENDRCRGNKALFLAKQ